MNVEQILHLIGALASVAGAAGVPLAGLAGTLLKALDELLVSEAARQGRTREEIAEATGIAGAANLAALAEDRARGE